MDIYTSSDINPWENRPETYLYFKHAHLELQSKDYVIYSFGSPESGGGMLPVFIDGESALSPYRGHFGGVQLFGEIDRDSTQQFLTEVLQDLKSKGIKNFQIKQAADCYGGHSPLVVEVFQKCGFTPEVIERNFHICVSDKLFVDHLHHSEKRKLNKCYESGVSMQVLGSQGLLESYELIRMARDEKDIPMSLSFDALNQLVKVFPKDHLVFQAYHKDTLIASCICIRNHQNVLYSFLPAHLSAYNHLSPLVILYEFIYDYCFKNGIGILDLGIATEDGIDNEGLIRFKKNLGGQESDKVSYLIDL